MRRIRALSLRARLLIASVAGLTAGLIAGGILLTAVLGYAQLRSMQGEAKNIADGVAALVEQNSLPDPIPVPAGVQAQVVDQNGAILAVSATADRLVTILYPHELAGLEDGDGRTIPGERIGYDGEVHVVQVTAGPPTAPLRILVAQPTGQISQSVHILKITLLVLYPVLIALLAAVLWRVLGAALQPVDALRAGAEEITGGTRAGRLPLPDSKDEIHRLAVTLNDMLHRLDSARARQRAFVADAAHELRSPLTNMRTELEVAQRLPDDTEWPELADDLLADVQRLARLVDDLLLLARSDEGLPATRVEEIDLAQFVGETAERYPDVEFDDPGTPLPLLAEPDALARVITNLLDNAVRHKRSAVTVSAAADGPDLLLVVTDDGPGIPEPDRERVFQRFTRLDDGRARDAGGSGLGLAIVRELVRRHRGTVVLRDAHPGLRVEVRLPWHRSPQQALLPGEPSRHQNETKQDLPA